LSYSCQNVNDEGIKTRFYIIDTRFSHIDVLVDFALLFEEDVVGWTYDLKKIMQGANRPESCGM
jgi:hypothetical protein